MSKKELIRRQAKVQLITGLIIMGLGIAYFIWALNL